MLAVLIATAVLAQCGTERWAVKTLTDPAARTVAAAAPSPSTVAQLTGRKPPPYASQRSRSADELTVWEVTGYVLGHKLEPGDSDFHVVLADSAIAPISRSAGSRATMIIEFPDADVCAPGSPHHADMKKARADFIRLAGQPQPGRFTRLRKPVRVVVRGVGFYDREHGQLGRAENVLELHPVLSIKAAPL
jgi:hypothetical protein